MNDIIHQINERIDDLESQNSDAMVKNMVLTELETYCRFAVALAMDEVTRPDNYLTIADSTRLENCKEKIREYFRFNTPAKTLGRQLDFANSLLDVFPKNNCPQSIRYIRDLVSLLFSKLCLRNVDAHELPITRTVQALRDQLNSLEENEDYNPYLDDDRVCVIVLKDGKPKGNGTDFDAKVMNAKRWDRLISARSLLRLSPQDDEEEAMRSLDRYITGDIAIHPNAVFLNVTFPDGTERLHLLSPLLAYFGGRQYGIYLRRQNTVFRTSLYIRLSGGSDSGLSEQVPVWDEHQQMIYDRTEHLRSISWNSPLFNDEESDTLRHCVKVSQSTDGSIHKYFLNVRKDRMHSTYPELWHAVWGNNRGSSRPPFFNFPAHDAATLAPLLEMFRSDKRPTMNPLQVCGQGGVGKTHTVINALFENFIGASVIDDYCMKFRYVIFLTAKRTMFNTNKEGPNVETWERPDFQSCDEALMKILTVLTDGRSNISRDGQEETEDLQDTSLLLRRICECIGSEPVLLIMDDLDSVRTLDQSLQGEARHLADGAEQIKLVQGLRKLTESDRNLRVIITTRRPLDETYGLQLMPLESKRAIDFAKTYYGRYDAGNPMPNSYREPILNIGRGVPAFIMRVVYLMFRQNSPEGNALQMQKLKQDIADFSLNTTSLRPEGRQLFMIMARLCNAMDAVPLGLLRLLLFDKALVEIQDAIDEMRLWYMVENRDNAERLALQNDSLILWSQQEQDEALKPHYQAVLNALRQDDDRWLMDYAIHPGTLMNKVFARLDTELDDEQKDFFAKRVNELVRTSDAFLQGMQNDPAEQEYVRTWVRQFRQRGRGNAPVPPTKPAGTKKPAPEVPAPERPAVKKPAPAPAQPTIEAVSPLPGEGEDNAAATQIRRALQGEWNTDRFLELLEQLQDMDFADPAAQAAFVSLAGILPRKLAAAVKAGQCDDDDRDRFTEILDELCGKYDEKNGGSAFDKYLAPYFNW